MLPRWLSPPWGRADLRGWVNGSGLPQLLLYPPEILEGAHLSQGTRVSVGVAPCFGGGP